MRAKKVHPANWCISKDRASGDGVALNALGCLILLDPPVGQSLDEMTRNYQAQLSNEFASHDCARHTGRRALAKANGVL
jgi:hypothetical protein